LRQCEGGEAAKRARIKVQGFQKSPLARKKARRGRGVSEDTPQPAARLLTQSSGDLWKPV
jgi:hypothetical protein